MMTPRRDAAFLNDVDDCILEANEDRRHSRPPPPSLVEVDPAKEAEADGVHEGRPQAAAEGDAALQQRLGCRQVTPQPPNLAAGVHSKVPIRRYPGASAGV